MRINLERTWSQDGQVILNLELHANREEHGFFQEMGFADISTSDQLLRKYFQDHEELYRNIGIEDSRFDDFHAFDTQFSNACGGFAKFLEAVTAEQLNSITEAVTVKINTEMNQRFHSIATSRVIALSPVKKLPVIKFPSSREMLRMQIGDQIYDLQPTAIPESTDMIQSIQTTATDALEASKGLFEEASQKIVESVEVQYKKEIERLKQEHQNMIPFPQWIGMDAVKASNVKMYYVRGLILFVLPFHFQQTHLRQSRDVYELKDNFKIDTKECSLVISVQNKRPMWFRLINKEFSVYPNYHTTGDTLCLGSYRSPKEDIESIEQLVKMRNDIQKVMTVMNTNSPGNRERMNTKQRQIRDWNSGHSTGNLKDFIKEDIAPEYVHNIGTR